MFVTGRTRVNRGRSNRTLNHRMMFSSVGKLKVLVPFALALSIAIARADFVETFSNGSDDGDWHLTNNPDRLLQIEASGGNPGAYLHGQYSRRFRFGTFRSVRPPPIS